MRGGSAATAQDPEDAHPEGLPDGAVDYEVDGAVGHEEEVVEVVQDEEEGRVAEAVPAEAVRVVRLQALLRVEGLQGEKEDVLVLIL